MNLRLKLALTGFLLSSSMSYAYTPVMGWYGGLMLGASFAQSLKFNVPNPLHPYLPSPTSFPGSLTYNVRGNGGGQIGYRCDQFRLEAEVNINSNSYNKLGVGGLRIGSSHNVKGLNIKGGTSVLSGFINGFFDFYNEENLNTTIVPYVGLGIGYAGVRNSIDFYINNRQINFLTAKATNNGPIGQVIGGINYFFSDELSVGTDVRYLSTRNIPRINSRFSVVQWNLLFNYSFNSSI
jgi:opacity protein-like surface antigen